MIEYRKGHKLSYIRCSKSRLRNPIEMSPLRAQLRGPKNSIKLFGTVRARLEIPVPHSAESNENLSSETATKKHHIQSFQMEDSKRTAAE